MRRLDKPALVPRECCSAEKTNCPGHCNEKVITHWQLELGARLLAWRCLRPTGGAQAWWGSLSQWLRLSSSWLPFLIIFCGEFLFRWKFASLDKNGRTILAMFKRMLQRTFILPGCIGCQKEREKWKNWFWCFFKCQMSNPGGWLWTRMLYVWDKMKILGGGVGGSVGIKC